LLIPVKNTVKKKQSGDVLTSCNVKLLHKQTITTWFRNYYPWNQKNAIFVFYI